MNKEIKAMSGSTDKILQVLEAEQIRRLNLSHDTRMDKIMPKEQ